MQRVPPGYGITTGVVPQWRVHNLSFQAGIPNQRLGSLSGGGAVVPRERAGPGRPVIVPNMSAMLSAIGGGALVGRAPFLVSLLQNPNLAQNPGSGV